MGRRPQKPRAPVEPPQLCARGSSDCQVLARSFTTESICRKAPHLHSFSPSCDASAASSNASWHHARARPTGFSRNNPRGGIPSGLSTLCTPPPALGGPSDAARRGRTPTECSAAPPRRTDSTVSTAAVSLGVDAPPAPTAKAGDLPSADLPVQSLSTSETSLPEEPENGAASEEASSSASLSSWNPLAILESKLSPRVRGLVLLNILTFLYGEWAWLCSCLMLGKVCLNLGTLS